MATLENFDARSLALDFSGFQNLFKDIQDRKFAEKQLALREEIQRGNLGVAEADLILRQDAAQSATTNQQSIQDTLAQLINPTQSQEPPQSQEPQIVPGQIIEEDVGEFPGPQVQTAPEVDLTRREELLLKLSGIKGGPAIVKSIEPLLKSRDMRAKVALQKEIEEKQRFALSLSRMASRGQQDRAIDREIIKLGRKGERDPFLTELRNMNDADREQELFLDIAQGDVLKDLAKNELTPQPDFTLSAGQRRFDASGKEIARGETKPPALQSLIGKLISDQQAVIESFGADSPQSQAVQEAIDAENKGEPASLTDVAGVRKEFTKLSGDFIKLRDAVKKVRRGGEAISAAGDLALIFNFMKILDPGSVVRESEFATAQNSAGVPDRVRNTWNRLLRGERLAPKQRADFVDRANQLFEGQRNSQIRLENSFRNLAISQGMKPEEVVIDFIGEFRPSGEGAKTIGRFKVEVE